MLFENNQFVERKADESFKTQKLREEKVNISGPLWQILSHVFQSF